VKNEVLKQHLAEIRNGDKYAFETLYSGLKTPVFTIISRVTWDRAVSEEILQDVFVKLFMSPPDPSIKNPRAYIFRMARNLAIDNMKNRKQTISIDEIHDPAHDPLNNVSTRMDINDALKSLPSLECQIVTLHIIGGLKFREIAEVMDAPLGTVLWRYQKAIGKLRTILGGTL